MLKIKKKDDEDISIKKAAVFGSDSEEEPEDAGTRFDRKYANQKAKDQRLVEQVLAEDPSAYEYDNVYDEIEKKKNEKTAEQREADKEKKPKYAHKILEAAKRREMEKQ
jgi:coiled-coil domain-containing protein 55